MLNLYVIIKERKIIVIMKYNPTHYHVEYIYYVCKHVYEVEETREREREEKWRKMQSVLKGRRNLYALKRNPSFKVKNAP
jgi:chloramphenicol O-acetyltransferase